MPPTMLVLLVLLGLLLIIGAVVPMAYLSARSDSSKVWLLSAFTFLATGVVVVLAVELVRIRLAAHLERDRF
jgi:hypothetical protein